MSKPNPKTNALKKTLEGLNYTKISKNTPNSELVSICCEIDKFLSIEYKTNIDAFADGKTNLSAQEVQDIQAVFPDANYLKKLLAWRKGEDWQDPQPQPKPNQPTNLCQECQQEPAKYKLTKKLDGQRTEEVKVCESCKDKYYQQEHTCQICQQVKQGEKLLIEMENGKEIKICQSCKAERERERAKTINIHYQTIRL